MSNLNISIAKGKGNINHNNREFVTENIDKAKIKDNIIYKQESLVEAYEKCFAATIDTYNSKQKRSDRKIDGAEGYIEKIKHSKNGEQVFYENVVQVGNMQDSHVGTKEGDIARDVIDDYMKGFEERNPNLYVFNAVLHLDEQTPHLHVDYIPLADDYKQGLQLRNSLDKALKQQGIDGKANKYEHRTKSWQNKEKDHIETLMKSRGLERAEETGLKAKHRGVENFKASVNIVKNEVKAIPTQIESKPKGLSKDKVVVKKVDLEQLEQRAKLSIVHEENAKKLIADISKIKADAHEKGSEYFELLGKQKDLNKDYGELTKAYQSQEIELSEAQAENTSLKAEIDDLNDSFSKKVQDIANPLKKQIKGLKTLLKATMIAYGDVTRALSMFTHPKSPYKVIFPDKQSKLINGIKNFSLNCLVKVNDELDEMSVPSCKYDLNQNLGISKHIKKFIEPEYPEKAYYKKGKNGLGLYDADGSNFYGGKDIVKDFREHNVKILDPQDLLLDGLEL